MNEPDFSEWARGILQAAAKENLLDDPYRIIREAVKYAYYQGYKVGLERGWAIEQDREISEKECDHTWWPTAMGKHFCLQCKEEK